MRPAIVPLVGRTGPVWGHSGTFGRPREPRRTAFTGMMKSRIPHGQVPAGHPDLTAGQPLFCRHLRVQKLLGRG